MLHEYFDGASGKCTSKLCYISDLNDDFVSKILETLPTSPKAVGNSKTKPSQELFTAFKVHLNCSDDLIAFIYSRLKDNSGDFATVALKMFRFYADEMNNLACIISLLVKIAMDEKNPQRDDSKKVLRLLVDGNFVDYLIKSLDSTYDFVFDSLIEALTCLFIYSSPSTETANNLIAAILKVGMERFSFASMASLFLAMINFEKLESDKTRLFSDATIARLSEEVKRVGVPELLLIWSCYLGITSSFDEKCQKTCYRVHLEFAQRSIDSAVFARLCEDKNGANFFRVYMAFISLFDISKLETSDKFCFCLARSIEGNPAICDSFWRNEEASKHLLDLITERFPTSCEFCIPLLLSLCQTEEGVEKVDTLLNRLTSLTLPSKPDPELVEEAYDAGRQEASYVALANFEAEISNVKIVISEESYCTTDCDARYYKWKIGYSGWDFLARAFSANLVNETFSVEVLQLFGRVFERSSTIKSDIEAFLGRVNALYFEPKGYCMKNRLLSALQMHELSLDVCMAIMKCLLALNVDEIDEEFVTSLMVLTYRVENAVSKYDCSTLEQQIGLEYLRFATSFISLITEEELRLSLVQSTELISRKLFNNFRLSLEMKLDLLKLALHFGEYSNEVNSICENNLMDCIRQSVHSYPLAGSLFDILCSAVLDRYQSQIYGLITETIKEQNLTDYFIVQTSQAKADLVTKFFQFLTAWSSMIHSGLPISSKSSELVCSMSNNLSDSHVQAEFVFSLNHHNLPLLKQLFAGSDGLTAELKKEIVSVSAVASCFLRHSLLKLRGSLVNFLEIVKIFPVTAKDFWDLCIKAVSICFEQGDLEAIDSSLQLFSLAIAKSSLDLATTHLISLLSSPILLDTLSDVAVEYPDLLDSFGDFFGVISSTSTTSLQKLLVSHLNDKLASHSVSFQVLTTLAKGCQLFKSFDEPSSVKLLLSLYERFEVVSSQGANIFSDDSTFLVWSNFVLLTLDVDFPAQAISGLTVLTRLIVSHISRRPNTYLPSNVLLLSRLVSDSRFGSMTVQIMNFYHLTESYLVNGDNPKWMLPVLLLNESYAASFVENDGLSQLNKALQMSPTDEHLWTALIFLLRFPSMAPLILYNVDFESLISVHNVSKLLDLLNIIVPAIFYPDDMEDWFAKRLASLAWSSLALPKLGSDSIKQALVILSLIIVPLSVSNCPLRHEMFEQRNAHIAVLDSIASGQTPEITQLAMALKDTLCLQ